MKDLDSNQDPINQCLRETELFSDLNEEQLARVAEILTIKQFKKNDVIFHQDIDEL